MKSINILLLIVSVGIVSIFGQPLQTTEESLSDREYGLPMTSASPRTIVQSKSIQGSEGLPINMDKGQKVLASLGNNTIVSESSFITLLKEIFPSHAFKANSSEESPSPNTNLNFNETAIFEVLKEIFPPNAFTEDTTVIPLDSEDYEDTAEDEDPEGLGPRLSATLLKILTF